MTLAQLHDDARVINDDAMRLGCAPPAYVTSYNGEHTLEIAHDRYVCYERARFRRAVAFDQEVNTYRWE